VLDELIPDEMPQWERIFQEVHIEVCMEIWENLVDLFLF
jgi:hypothetical protein